MKKKIIGIFVCMLLIVTILPTTKIVVSDSGISEKSRLNIDQLGVRWMYKSKTSIPSPNGNNYTCMMYCSNHNQTLNWISLIDQLGFQKAWNKHLMKLNIILLLPGSILLFGLNDFMLWYYGLFLKQKHKADFLNCLNNYDKINGAGIISYSWISGLKNNPFDFEPQPDNSWIENSWVMGDNGFYIPNPEIWEGLSIYV